MFLQPTSHYGLRACKWFNKGQKDIVGWFRFPGEELYLPGEPAAGNIVGKIAGNVLTPAGAPTYQQTLTGQDGDPLGVGIAFNSLNSFDAANAAIHDYSTGPFAMLVSYAILDVSAAVYLSILGKRDPVLLNGYELQLRLSPTKRYGLAVDSGAVTRADLMVDPAIGLHYAFVYRNGTAIGIETDVGIATNTVGIAESFTNAGIFALGSAYINSFGGVIGPTVIWSGANAQNVIPLVTQRAEWWAA